MTTANLTGPVMCIVGARPNFMKMAPILRALAAHQPPLPAMLVHTGQHYDASMSDKLFADLRSGKLRALAVSKVGNFAIDLPDANVAIQVSGTFGSRQEEAQRLGRILRPKSDGSGAVFYSVVTLGSRDQEFAERRQLFLTEQGYAYEILEAQQLEPAEQARSPR